MSSIATEDLFNEDDGDNNIINDVVKSVEEMTMLRQRRSIAVKVKLQEINDRKNKLDKLRLGRLESEGIYIDLERIRNEIQHSLSSQTMSDQLRDSVSIDKSQKTLNNPENSALNVDADKTLDMDIQKNIEQQDKLSKTLENMQRFNAKKTDMDAKQVKPVRRRSISSTTSGSRPSSQMNNKVPISRRKSISHDGSDLNRKSSKSRTVKRRGSLGVVSDRVKANGSVTLLDPIINDNLKKSAKLVKNALKIKNET